MSELRDTLQETLGAGYTVERELGGGGMSRVFVVLEKALGRRIVVKVLSPELAATVSVDRFKREIMMVAALQHPHIVGVLSAGETDGLPYFTMPFVEGESLRARIERGGKLSVREAVSVMKDVARALTYAHERGVVHRDIKPDNVLLSAGSATVTDFGVAKAVATSKQDAAFRSTTTSGTLTLIGTSLGTPAYMAPEQAAADPSTDHRADLYAFGIMSYEMLTGHAPFQSKTPQALLAAHLTETPRPLTEINPDVPARLAALIARCLEKEREKRPQTAREIVDALEDPAIISGTFSSPALPAARVPARHRALLWSVAVVLVVAGAFALGRFRAAPTTSQTASQQQAAATPVAAPSKSLVVLPLVSIGSDSAGAYLADGMTTELITALSRIPGLRVASRTASFGLKERATSASEIGKALNVSMLLEGTVQRERNRLRVTARLVNTTDGFMLWSDMYEREVRDVFSVQDEISGAIAETLGERIAESDTGQAKHGTTNRQAYDLYLRGRYYFEKRGAASLHKALALFNDAVKQDSTYALAYAGIANVYALLPLYDRTSPDAVFPRALSAATHAVELDSTLAEAYAARASLLNASWRWAEAENDFRHAVRLDSAYAQAYQWYGEHLLVRGRTREAIGALDRAASLDPSSPVIAASRAVALGVAGRSDDAIAQARHAVDLDSSSTVARLMLGAVYAYAGRAKDAVPELEVALGLGRDAAPVQGMLGYAYAQAGERDRAQAMARELEGRTDGDAAAALAHIHLGLGDTTRALADLERALGKRAAFFSAESMASPVFASLRGSARFRSILEAAGLQDLLQGKLVAFAGH